ncbi:MAG: hypothetical protein ING89_07860 [Rubrivivax sp.]|nr:hypothetical protein [Rubrivivax sp.]
MNESEAELTGGPAKVAVTFPPPRARPRILKLKLAMAPVPTGLMAVQVNTWAEPTAPLTEQPAGKGATTSSTEGESTVTVSGPLPLTRVTCTCTSTVCPRPMRVGKSIELTVKAAHEGSAEKMPSKASAGARTHSHALANASAANVARCRNS